MELCTNTTLAPLYAAMSTSLQVMACNEKSHFVFYDFVVYQNTTPQPDVLSNFSTIAACNTFYTLLQTITLNASCIWNVTHSPLHAFASLTSHDFLHQLLKSRTRLLHTTQVNQMSAVLIGAIVFGAVAAIALKCYVAKVANDHFEYTANCDIGNDFEMDDNRLISPRSTFFVYVALAMEDYAIEFTSSASLYDIVVPTEDCIEQSPLEEPAWHCGEATGENYTWDQNQSYYENDNGGGSSSDSKYDINFSPGVDSSTNESDVVTVDVSSPTFELPLGSIDSNPHENTRTSFQLDHALNSVIAHIQVDCVGSFVMWKFIHPAELAVHLWYVCLEIAYNEADTPTALLPWTTLDSILSSPPKKSTIAPEDFWYRFVVSSVPCEEQNEWNVVYSDWELLERKKQFPSPSFQSNESQVALVWASWPDLMVQVSVVVEIYKDETWHKVFDGPIDTIVIQRLEASHAYEIRVAISNFTLLSMPGIVAFDSRTEWTEFTVFTAPMVEMWGVNQTWWLHFPKPLANFSKKCTLVRLHQAIEEEETLDLSKYSIITQHLEKNSLYEIHVQFHDNMGTATTSTTTIDTNSELCLKSQVNDLTTTLQWTALPPWLECQLYLALQKYSTEDDWETVPTCGSRIEINPKEAVEEYRLALIQMKTNQVVQSSCSVFLLQSIPINVFGFGCHARATWHWQLPPHFAQYSVTFALILTQDESSTKVDQELTDDGNGAYSMDIVLEPNLEYSFALVASLDGGGISPQSLATYSTSWSACAIDVIDILHNQAKVIATTPKPLWYSTGLESIVEIKSKDKWVVVAQAQAKANNSMLQMECILNDLPSHSKCTARVSLRWATIQPFENVKEVKFITACGSFKAEAQLDGSIELQWPLAPIGNATYDVQYFDPIHNQFMSWTTTSDCSFKTPVLNLPLQLVWLRIQTNLDSGVLHGLCQYCLTAPKPMTIALLAARSARLEFKGFNRAHLPRHLMPFPSEKITYTMDLSDLIECDFKVHNTVTITNLKPATKYSTRLQCTCKVDTTLTLTCYSPIIEFTTLATIPDPPANINVDEVVLPVGPQCPSCLPSSYLRVHWAAAVANGRAITGYALEMAWKQSVEGFELLHWTGIYVGTELIYCPTVHEMAHDSTHSVVAFRLQAANELGLSEYVYSVPVEVSNVCGRTSTKLPLKPIHLKPIKSPSRKLTTVASLPRIEIDNLVSPCKQYACSRNLPIPSDGFRAERRKWFEMAVAQQAQKKPSLTEQATALYAQHGKIKPMRKSSI